VRALKILLATIISLAALAIVLVYGVIYYANSDAATQLIITSVQKQTGRELVINGDVSPKLSLTPVLTVTDVSLSNPDWAKKDFLLKAQTLEIGIELLPLLEGDTRIQSIALRDAQLALESSGSKHSWEFDKQKEPEAAKEVKPEDLTEQDQKSSQINIATLELTNTDIYYRDGKTDYDIHVADAMADGLDLVAGTVSNIHADGRFEKAPLVIDASLAEKQVLQFDAALKGTPHSLSAKGTIGLNDMAFDGNISLDTPSLKKLGSLIDQNIADETALKLRADMGGTPKLIKLSNLKATYGDYPVTGNLTINTSSSPIYISGSVASEKLAFGQAEAPEPAPNSPVTSQDAEVQEGDTSAELPTGLNAVNADLDIAIGALSFGKVTIANAKTKAELKDGRLRLNPLTGNTARGSINGSVDYNSAAEIPALAVNLKADDVMLGDLLAAFGSSDKIQGGAINAYVKLNGFGKTVNQYLASTSGDISFLAKNTVYRDPPQITKAASFFNLLQPQGDDLVVECALANFKVRSGIATSQVIAAKAPGAYVSGEGETDLARQRMNLTFQARSNLIGFADIAPPMKMKGKWSNPTVSVDKSSTFINLGKWVVGTVTGVGLFAMAGEQLFDKIGVTRNDPCVQKLEESDQQAREANQNPKETFKNAEDAVSDRRDEIKEQFDAKEKEIRNIRDGIKGMFHKNKAAPVAEPTAPATEAPASE
tara:strand:+ start:409 stop:2541 length:2133 start_codon:yes stop_codon:yes gene_type:complete